MASNYRVLLTALCGLGLTASAHAGQMLDVEIIDRQDNASVYTYVVPGRSTSSTNATVRCSTLGNSTDCNGAANISTATTPGYVGSYEVSGATLSLQLPDGRIAVVNCAGKMSLAVLITASAAAHRSCRVPLVPKLQADFSGDKAKLRWPVSIDGKKTQSETYRILAVLEKR